MIDIGRFLSKTQVISTGCIEWTRAKDYQGYGVATFNSKSIRAHRLSYMIFVGNIPPNMYVLHRCDNPSCVNAKHLFLGTNKENMRDKVLKGRQANGEKNGNSRMKEEEILQIRKLYLSGVSMKEISKKFNSNVSQVHKIIRRKLWGHI